MIGTHSESIYTLEQKTEILEIDFKVLLESYLNCHWTLSIKRLARNRLGQCNFTKRVIELNKDYLEINTIFDFKDTLRHEIAHAIVYEKYMSNNKRSHIKPHGKEWKETAKYLGAIPKSCSKGLSVKPRLNYWLQCSIHGVVESWVKRPAWLIKKNTRIFTKFICGRCKTNGTPSYLKYMTVKNNNELS